jgi:hypothetical protein
LYNQAFCERGDSGSIVYAKVSNSFIPTLLVTGRNQEGIGYGIPFTFIRFVVDQRNYRVAPDPELLPHPYDLYQFAKSKSLSE